VALFVLPAGCGSDGSQDGVKPTTAKILTVGTVKRCIEHRLKPKSIKVMDAGEGSYALYVPAIGFESTRGNGGVFLTKRPVLTHLLVRGVEYESWVTEDEEALMSVTRNAIVDDLEACLARAVSKVEPTQQTEDGLITRRVVDGVEVTQVAVTAKDWADYLIEGDSESFATQCADFSKVSNEAERAEFYDAAQKGWYGSEGGGAALAENMRLDGVRLRQVLVEMLKQCA
jgi:hypothetical protein